MTVRKPHVAGTFYPADPEELREFCQTRFSHSTSTRCPRAVILPHAGYFFSGDTACEVLSRITIPQVNFLIGPNHTGYGSKFAIMDEGQWATPLGSTAIHGPLAEALLESSPALRVDEPAHRYEHSLEVELPLLQVKNESAQIVPLIVGTLDLNAAREIALACARVIVSWPEPILLVVSNDMSHYESDEVIRKKDRYALEAIESLDEEALARAVRQHRITMCGFVPVYMLLVMKQSLGIQKASLIDYRTSGDVTGDRDRVVGYAGFILD